MKNMEMHEAKGEPIWDTFQVMWIFPGLLLRRAATALELAF